MNLRIGYKVVTPCAGKLVSAVANGYRNYGVEYKVGELVRPNVLGTYLMAFETLGQAKAFAVWDNQIYEAILVDPEPLNCVLSLSILSKSEGSFVAECWERMKSKSARCMLPWTITNNAPTGTLACAQIQLIKRID